MPLQPPAIQQQPAPPPHLIQSRPTKPVMLLDHVISESSPGNSGSGGQLIPSGDDLQRQFPVSNSPTNEQPLDLSTKVKDRVCYLLEAKLCHKSLFLFVLLI